MEIVLRTGFAAISFSISFYSASIDKGKWLVEASHVKRVEEIEGFAGHKQIRSSVIPSTSITNPPYKVKLDVSLVIEYLF